MQRRAALWLLCMVLPTSTMHAQEVSPGTLDEYESMSLEELLDTRVVTTASKRKESTKDAPGTVIVLSRNDIRLRGYSHLQDVFRDLPGMESLEYYFSEMGTLVPVRGVIGNNKLVVLINGMRVNPPGGENMPLRADISVRNAEQIEVIYGPGSTLYGQDAINAVINVITRSETPRSINAGMAVGYPARAEAWATLSHDFKLARVSASAHATGASLMDFSKEYPAFWATYRDVATPKGSGTLPVRPDRGVNVMLSAESEHWTLQAWHRWSARSSAEGYAPVMGYLPEGIWSDASSVMELQNRLPLATGITLESSLRFNRFEVQPYTRYTWQIRDDAWFMDDFKYGIGHSVTLEERFSLQLSPSLFVTAGVIGGLYDITPKATIPGGADQNKEIVGQAGDVTYYTNQGDPQSAVTVNRAQQTRYQSVGGYIEGAWNITESLKLIVGTRLDIDTRFKAVPFSPRIAAIMHFTKELTGKYTFTRAYVAPPAYYSGLVFDNGFLLNVPNKALEPETATSHELNFTFNTAHFDAGISAYFNRQTNLFTGEAGAVVRNEVWVDPEGTQKRQLVVASNSGDSTAIGGDAYGRYTVGPVSGWASYSYVDFVLTKGGKTSGLDGISRHNIRLGVTHAILPNLFATTSLVLRSTPENFGDAGTLTREVQDPYVINLHVVFAPTRHLDIFADVRNATNRHAALRGLFPAARPMESFRASMGVQFSD